MKSCCALLASAALVLPLLAADPAAAQGRRAPKRPAPDFLFSTPKGSVTIRGGWLLSRSGSDWYDFVTDHLTLDKSDFNVPGFGADLNIAITPRIDAQFAFDLNRARASSEYRRFVDNKRLPIEQETRLREANLGGNVKVALTERGRRVSQFVWVPRTIVPYVGGGAGAMRFDMSQSGDFVDFVDFSVFSDVFRASGWAPSAQVFGGADIRVFRQLFVTVDGRYLWAAGVLGRDWLDFDKLDLAGFRLTGGINVIF